MEMPPSDRLAQDRLLDLETGVAATFFILAATGLAGLALVSLAMAPPVGSNGARSSAFIYAVSASVGEGGYALAASPPPPAAASEGPVLPPCLPQQRQRLLLQPLLVAGR